MNISQLDNLRYFFPESQTIDVLSGGDVNSSNTLEAPEETFRNACYRLNTSEVPSSIQGFLSLVESNSYKDYSLVNLGVAYIQNGEIRKAVDCFREILNSYTGSDNSITDHSLHNLSFALLAENTIDEVPALLSKISDKNYRGFSILNAEYYLQKNEFETAVEFVKKELLLDQDSVHAAKLLGRIISKVCDSYLTEKKHISACKYIAELRAVSPSIRPSGEDLDKFLSRWATSLNDSSVSTALIGQAKEKNSSRSFYYLFTAYQIINYLVLDQWEPYENYLKTTEVGLDATPTHYQKYKLGIALAALGKFAQAKEIFRDLLVDIPRSKHSQLSLDDCYRYTETMAFGLESASANYSMDDIPEELRDLESWDFLDDLAKKLEWTELGFSAEEAKRSMEIGVTDPEKAVMLRKLFSADKREKN